jgi:hypothetical protein
MSFNTIEMEITEATRKFFRQKDARNPIGSYFQYKGTLFRTEALNPLRIVPLNIEELQRLIDNFKVLHADKKSVMDFLDIEGLDCRLKEIKEEIEYIDDPYERAGKEINLISDIFRVNTFNKVKVSFASDICMFWCPSCHELFFESDIRIDTKLNYPYCPKCDRVLQQTPIWILKNETGKALVTPFTVWIRPFDLNDLWKRWFNKDYVKCRKCKGIVKLYISLDPARIFESSKVVCQDCGRKYGLYSKNYSLVAPTANITIPLMATTFSRTTINFGSIDIKEKLLDSTLFDVEYVKDFLFTPRVKVKELVLAFWHGLKVKRILEVERTGMELVTSGIFVELREDYFSEALEFMKEIYKENPIIKRELESEELVSSRIKRIVLHSLAHAIESKLPVYSGLSIDNFSYLYDIHDNSILIYERCQGGLGASYLLTQLQEERKEPIILDLLMQVRDTLESCDCDDRCKYCLALVGCQEFNQNLNRFSLGPLFRLDAEDVSWGF